MTDEKGAIDPRIYQFTWDLNAECNWDELAGIEMKDIDLKNPKHLRWLVFCGLKDNIEGITLVDVGKMIKPENSFEIYKMVFKKIYKAQVEPEKKEDAPTIG